MPFRRWLVVARRICLGLVVLIAMFSIGLRVQTYLLTRKIHAVIAGLEHVQIDKTSEQDLLKTVPGLILQPSYNPSANRSYGVQIRNVEDRSYYGWTRWIPDVLLPRRNADELDPLYRDKAKFLTFPLSAAYAFGWRYLSFSAYVTLFNGTVSSTGYNLEPDVPISYPLSYFVVVRSVHGFSRNGGHGLVPVHSADDERPEFRFGPVAGEFSMLTGVDSAIGVAYTTDASRDLIHHAFQVDLGCFWGIRGCDSVRQVAPLLWQDRRAVGEAAMTRLRSNDPCPGKIVSGRVRYLLDVNVALLEVIGYRSETFNDEGDNGQEIVTDYRLMEIIRGHPEGPWTNVRHRWLVQSSRPVWTINPELWREPRPGDLFLFFSGASFDSCRILPATQAALSAVRAAIPAPRRSEDDIGWMFGRK